MPWVGLQCVIVVFPGPTHLLFYIETSLYIGKAKCSDSCEPAQSGLSYVLIQISFNSQLCLPN